MKKLLISFFALVVALTVGVTADLAQAVPVSNNPAGLQPLSEAEIVLLRRDLRSEKKKLIAMNVPMTDTEATRFWPVYDQYVEEMTKVHSGFYAAVKDYSANNASWTDAQSAAFLDKWVNFQVEEGKTRQKYLPMIAKAIPAKKAALFFQIDRRLYVLMDLQVATLLPLVTQ